MVTGLDAAIMGLASLSHICKILYAQSGARGHILLGSLLSAILTFSLMLTDSKKTLT